MFVVVKAICDLKSSTILVYMILNDNRNLTGCSLHGYSLFPFPFNSSIQYICLFPFLLLFQVFFLTRFVVSIYIIVEYGVVEDYIKCGLIGRRSLRSPRHLNTFSNLFIVAVHYKHINTYFVLLLLWTP